MFFYLLCKWSMVKMLSWIAAVRGYYPVESNNFWRSTSGPDFSQNIHLSSFIMEIGTELLVVHLPDIDLVHIFNSRRLWNIKPCAVTGEVESQILLFFCEAATKIGSQTWVKTNPLPCKLQFMPLGLEANLKRFENIVARLSLPNHLSIQNRSKFPWPSLNQMFWSKAPQLSKFPHQMVESDLVLGLIFHLFSDYIDKQLSFCLPQPLSMGASFTCIIDLMPKLPFWWGCCKKIFFL